MIARNWTSKEVDAAAHLCLVKRWTHQEIADHLGRSRMSVMWKLNKVGAVRYRKRRLVDYAKLIRRHNARGWTDARISRSLGICQQVIGRWRRALGLSKNKPSRKEMQRRYRDLLRRHDVRSLHELHWMLALEREAKGGAS